MTTALEVLAAVLEVAVGLFVVAALDHLIGRGFIARGKESWQLRRPLNDPQRFVSQ